MSRKIVLILALLLSLVLTSGCQYEYISNDDIISEQTASNDEAVSDSHDNLNENESDAVSLIQTGKNYFVYSTATEPVQYKYKVFCDEPYESGKRVVLHESDWAEERPEFYYHGIILKVVCGNGVMYFDTTDYGKTIEYVRHTNVSDDTLRFNNVERLLVVKRAINGAITISDCCTARVVMLFFGHDEYMYATFVSETVLCVVDKTEMVYYDISGTRNVELYRVPNDVSSLP